MRFEDRVALVTGGASGIGEATVRRFHAEGGSVIIADLAVDRGTSLAAELGRRAAFVRLDVTQEADVAGGVDLACDRYGQLDFMFNNAGIIGIVGPISSLPIDDFDRTMAVLVRGPMLGMKHAARVMTPQHRGVIVNTSSPSALRAGGPHTYTAAKAALLAVTRSVAAELWQHNIRVNSLVPGATWTRLHPDKRQGRIPAAQAGVLGTDPKALSPEQLRLSRQMDPAEMAAAALYLASDDASFVTGHALVVDGGATNLGPGGMPFVEGRFSDPMMIGPPD